MYKWYDTMYDTAIKAKFPFVVLINEIIFTSYRTGELIPNLYLYIFYHGILPTTWYIQWPSQYHCTAPFDSFTSLVQSCDRWSLGPLLIKDYKCHNYKWQHSIVLEINSKHQIKYPAWTNKLQCKFLLWKHKLSSAVLLLYVFYTYILLAIME